MVSNIKKEDIVSIKAKTNKEDWSLPGEWEVRHINIKNVCTVKEVGNNNVKTTHILNLIKKQNAD